MTLTGQAVVKSTTAFDINKINAENPFIIHFIWNGPKCNGSRLTIIETGLSHEITGRSSTFYELTDDICNALGLTNNNSYHATITMLDNYGEPISNPSEQFLLHCYPTPTFAIRNIFNNSTIDSTEFVAILNYFSSKMELTSYKFNLYNNTGKALLESSKELYITADSSTTDFSNCSYTFKGLENGESYIIEAVGVTVYNMELKCSYHFSVNANASNVYSLLLAEATHDGNITVTLGCIPMKYDSSDTLTYIANEEIDLRNKNDYVKYTLVKPLKNFKLKAKLRAIKDFTKPIFSFIDSSNEKAPIFFLIPEIQYTHGIVQIDIEPPDIDDYPQYIRPKLFKYDNITYLDYIKGARLLLKLNSSDGKYSINDNYLDLLYDINNDEFYIDENKNIIIEITKYNGNYGFVVTEI